MPTATKRQIRAGQPPVIGITTKTARITVALWRRSPERFFDHVLGAVCYPKQAAILQAVARHSRVAVCGANGTGKDWAAGRLLLWWLQTRRPAKVVVIGPTERQAHDVVFSEAQTAFRQARVPLGGVMAQTARYQIYEETFAVGFATDNPLNIQGYHSPNLLVIITEAHNVAQSHVDAIKRLNPACLLLTGNALATSGEFHAAFYEARDAWHTVHIAAQDVPGVADDAPEIPGLITRQRVAEAAAEWGIESPLYVASILGQFPDNLEDALVALRDALAAVNRPVDPPGKNEGAVLACDVARFGEDKTVVYRRHGRDCRLVWKVQGRDTQAVAGQLIRLAAADPAVKTIVVDDTGVGGGVTDRLREERIPNMYIVAFNGGSAARNPSRYYNAVTEAWLNLAAAYKAGTINTDDNRALVAQLTSRRYSVRGDGRLQLEPKADYKKRGGGSPDDADALAMAWYNQSGGASVSDLLATGNARDVSYRK